MLEKINKAARVGNINNCFTPDDEKEFNAIEYCENNFQTDYQRYNECKNMSSFCYVCCENEFGDLHIMERDRCYNKCDSAGISSDSSI